jgi:ankyrin repeat protein
MNFKIKDKQNMTALHLALKYGRQYDLLLGAVPIDHSSALSYINSVCSNRTDSPNKNTLIDEILFKVDKKLQMNDNCSAFNEIINKTDDKTGLTPICVAIQNHNVQIVKSLIEKWNADIYCLYGNGQDYPILAAARTGSIEILEIIINKIYTDKKSWKGE